MFDVENLIEYRFVVGGAESRKLTFANVQACKGSVLA